MPLHLDPVRDLPKITTHKPRVLVACEFSGRVRDAFLATGHDAWSCDILPTDVPGPHIEGKVEDILDDGWDLMVAHPPCTYLCNSGSQHLYLPNGKRNPERWEALQQAAMFFSLLLHAPIPHICIENPILHRHAKERIVGYTDPTQTIQPYQYGHPHTKRTCLWLRNLPPLLPTKILERPASGRWDNQTPCGADKTSPGPDRWKIRSTTYAGIAQAMGQQWRLT